MGAATDALKAVTDAGKNVASATLGAAKEVVQDVAGKGVKAADGVISAGVGISHQLPWSWKTNVHMYVCRDTTLHRIPAIRKPITTLLAPLVAQVPNRRM